MLGIEKDPEVKSLGEFDLGKMSRLIACMQSDHDLTIHILIKDITC